jgi:hypothetical protein
MHMHGPDYLDKVSMLLDTVNSLVTISYHLFILIGLLSFLLIGYPALPDLQLEPQFPSVALLNWTTGEGTAKYWITKLLIETADIDNDQAVVTQTTDVGGQHIFSQAFIGKNGRRWVLIINKRSTNIDVFLPGCTGGRMQIVNEASGFGPATEVALTLSQITLAPFAVAVVHMPVADIE